MPDDKWLTTTEAATLSGIGQGTLRNDVPSVLGRHNVRKRDGNWEFREAAIVALVVLRNYKKRRTDDSA